MSRAKAWRTAALWSAAVVLLAALAANAWRHDWRISYDILAHTKYARVLAGGTLPSAAESREFFNPPLSYVPSAVAYRLGADNPAAVKIGQMTQAVFGLLTLAGVALALRRRGGLFAVFVAVLFVLTASAWWRTFAMYRPEALLAALVALAVWQTAGLFAGRRSTTRFALCGLTWGLACLTRQWGICALLGVVAATPLAPRAGRRWWAGVAVAAGVCAAVAGPFYLSLHWRFGSMRAFNIPPAESAHLDWRWRPFDAARAPTMNALSARPLDILSADVFGDYWLAYVATGRTRMGIPYGGTRLLEVLDRRPKGFATNVDTIGPTLTRSIYAGIVVTSVAVLAVLAGVGEVGRAVVRRRAVPALPLVATAAVLGTLAGYAWFVVRYTDAVHDSDTVKGTYLMSAWAVIGVLVGRLATRAAGRCRWRRAGVIAAMLVLAALTCGTWFTRVVAAGP